MTIPPGVKIKAIVKRRNRYSFDDDDDDGCERISNEELAERTRPQLPRPMCRVILVCGPPASGKTTYVKQHAAPDDIVIDLDDIALEFGYGRERPSKAIGLLLGERNQRLAALILESSTRVAWVILMAPAQCLREWWADMLGVAAQDLIVLVPPRAELYRRIAADPERSRVCASHCRLVDEWFAKERNNDPGIIKPGVSADGVPNDPLHFWNRSRASAIG